MAKLNWRKAINRLFAVTLIGLWGAVVIDLLGNLTAEEDWELRLGMARTFALPAVIVTVLWWVVRSLWPDCKPMPRSWIWWTIGLGALPAIMWVLVLFSDEVYHYGQTLAAAAAFSVPLAIYWIRNIIKDRREKDRAGSS